MKLTGKFDVRVIAGEYVLMPVGDALLDGVSKPMWLNETMGYVTSLIASGKTEDEVAACIVEDYGLALADAKKELLLMIKQLTVLGMLAQND